MTDQARVEEIRNRYCYVGGEVRYDDVRFLLDALAQAERERDEARATLTKELNQKQPCPYIATSTEGTSHCLLAEQSVKDLQAQLVASQQAVEEVDREHQEHVARLRKMIADIEVERDARKEEVERLREHLASRDQAHDIIERNSEIGILALQAENASLHKPLTWTTEKPTQAAFYWYRFKRAGISERVIEVSAELFVWETKSGHRWPLSEFPDGAEWAGPLTPPKDFTG